MLDANPPAASNTKKLAAPVSQRASSIPWWKQWGCFGSAEASTSDIEKELATQTIEADVSCKGASQARDEPSTSLHADPTAVVVAVADDLVCCTAAVASTPEPSTPSAAEPEEEASCDQSKLCDGPDQRHATAHSVIAPEQIANMANIATRCKQQPVLGANGAAHAPRRTQQQHQHHASTGGSGSPSTPRMMALLANAHTPVANANTPRQQAFVTSNVSSATSSPRLQALFSKSMPRNSSATGFHASGFHSPLLPSGASPASRSPLAPASKASSNNSPRNSNNSSRDFFTTATQLIVLSCQLESNGAAAAAAADSGRTPRTLMDTDTANRRRSLQLEGSTLSRQRQQRSCGSPAWKTSLDICRNANGSGGGSAAAAAAAAAAAPDPRSSTRTIESFMSANSSCRDTPPGGSGAGAGTTYPPELHEPHTSAGSAVPSSSLAAMAAVEEHWMLASGDFTVDADGGDDGPRELATATASTDARSSGRSSGPPAAIQLGQKMLSLPLSAAGGGRTPEDLFDEALAAHVAAPPLPYAAAAAGGGLPNSPLGRCPKAPPPAVQRWSSLLERAAFGEQRRHSLLGGAAAAAAAHAPQVGGGVM